MKRDTSIEWLRRTQRMTPLTVQERAVAELLTTIHLPYESHHAFKLSSTLKLAVDFLVFVRSGVVLECTYCSKRRGAGTSEVVRRAAYMNYRFQLIKRSFPRMMCGAVIEAPNERQNELRDLLLGPLTRADFVSVSMDVLGDALQSLVGDGL